MKTEKRHITILGAGESGVGAALLAQSKGFEVFVSDYGTIKEVYKTELEANEIAYEEGQHTKEIIFQSNEIIKSPGIPDHIPMIKELNERGISVISEIEFAARYSDAYHIAITGSNGKTTTTELTAHLLEQAGVSMEKVGNIGYSFARSLVENTPKKHYVMELSSFQLDGIKEFRPDLAILLNITPDHLDRYEYNMQLYIASKFRIGMNQQQNDIFFYNADDENIKQKLQSWSSPATKWTIDQSMIDGDHISINGGTFDLSQTSLKGIHNAMNALFAVRVAQHVGIQEKEIQAGLNSFKGVSHRLELVGSINGVPFFNDSKATNVDAVYYGLQAMTPPVIWIAGGKDKGNEYEVLLPLVKANVKKLIAIGVDNSKLIEVFGGVGVEIEEASSAEEALTKGFQAAEKGDVVLLSPACASFDRFKNYIARGNQFKEAFKHIQNQMTSNDYEYSN
ncbi:MAG: UDP-N-acetylmuramoyl-L-alanine--D-glutamate ligase [Bacteroidota bacterium]